MCGFSILLFFQMDELKKEMAILVREKRLLSAARRGEVDTIKHILNHQLFQQNFEILTKTMLAMEFFTTYKAKSLQS